MSGCRRAASTSAASPCCRRSAPCSRSNDRMQHGRSSRTLLKEQFLLVRLDEERAMRAIPRLLPDERARRAGPRSMPLLQVLGARGALPEEGMRRLGRVEALFGVEARAAGRGGVGPCLTPPTAASRRPHEKYERLIAGAPASMPPIGDRGRSSLRRRLAGERGRGGAPRPDRSPSWSVRRRASARWPRRCGLDISGLRDRRRRSTATTRPPRRSSWSRRAGPRP